MVDKILFSPNSIGNFLVWSHLKILLKYSKHKKAYHTLEQKNWSLLCRFSFILHTSRYMYIVEQYIFIWDKVLCHLCNSRCKIKHLVVTFNGFSFEMSVLYTKKKKKKKIKRKIDFAPSSKKRSLQPEAKFETNQ